MLQLLSLSSFRISKGYIMDLCCTCSLCLPSYVSTYTYTYIWVLFAVCFTILCEYVHVVYPRAYIYTRVYMYVLYIYAHILHMPSYVPVGLPCESEVFWVSFSLETGEFVIFLWLHNLDKLKLKGFIKKKWILPSHTLISSSLVNRFYWREFHCWIIALRTAVTWGCLVEVTLEKVVIFLKFA